MKQETVKLDPLGYWGKRPYYSAKIGTGPSAIILIKRVRAFHVGQYIKYCKKENTAGQCIGTAPTWSGGVIYKIESERLFVECM